MSYIEREAVIKYLEKYADGYSYIETPTESAIADIKAIPTADVVEVRHGRWIYDCERTMGDGWIYKQYHCSACGKQEIGAMQNYCPNCGAKMDGGADDGNS